MAPYPTPTTPDAPQRADLREVFDALGLHLANGTVQEGWAVAEANS